MNFVEIKFPAIDVTIENWNSEDINEVILFDTYFYNKSDKVFHIYRMNHTIIDSDGSVFKIVGVGSLKTWQYYFPFFIKRKMFFHDCKEKIPLEDLRSIILKKIADIEENNFKLEWKKNVEEAKNFNDLILGN